MSTLDRFSRLYIPEPNSGCWLWLGALNAAGYGRFAFNGKNSRAHRVAYQLMKGAIPRGRHLDHLCRMPCCVNPDHLEPVTNRENVVRGYKARGLNTHCVNGHFIDGITVWRSGTECSECRRDRGRTPEFRDKK